MTHARKLLTLLAATACAGAIAAPALAADPTPLRGGMSGLSGLSGYVALRGGLTYGDKTSFDAGGLATLNDVSIETDYDMGGLVAGAVGIRRGALRGEIEVSYARYGVDTHTGVGRAGSTSDVVRVPFTEKDSLGDASAISAMVSAYYDFDFGRLSPFVGGGIGIGQLRTEGYGVASLATGTFNGVVLDDQDIGLAYHATVGANFTLNDRIGLELAYRYQGIDSEITTVNDIETQVELTSHNVIAGVRVGF